VYKIQSTIFPKRLQISMRRTFRDWIYANKLTVCRVAEMLHVDRSYLYMIFRGDRKPTEELVSKIYQLTGIRYKAGELLDKR
jgi:transcriptional regulator with XRE-family HTH domain